MHHHFLRAVAAAAIAALPSGGPLAAQRPVPAPLRSKTIVFLHGMFQNAASWDHWRRYYTALGYRCYAPSYPYHRGAPAELKRRIDPRLADLEFRQVLDSTTAFVDRLPEKPILVGHSMGGLLVQKLVAAGKAEAGVCLAPANPRGIGVLNWDYLRANFRMVDPLRNRNKVCTPPMRWFRRTFFNTLPAPAATTEYATYFVPESRKIAKSSTRKGLEIDFCRPHVPLLFVAGEADQDLPPALIRKNFAAYQDPGSTRAYRVFPGRSHYLCSEPGWEDIAAAVAQWLARPAANLPANTAPETESCGPRRAGPESRPGRIPCRCR